MYTAKNWKESHRFINLSNSEFVSYLLEKDIKNMFFSVKYDGILASASVFPDQKKVIVFSRNGLVIEREKFPFEESLLYLSNKKGGKPFTLVGELVALDSRGNQLPFNKTVSIIRTGDLSQVHFYVFDIGEIQGIRLENVSFFELEKFLEPISSSSRTPKLSLPMWSYGGANEFKALFDYVTKNKLEGIVARYNSQSDNRLFRIKITPTVDCVIVSIGNKQSTLWNRGEISFIRIAFLTNENHFVLSTKVGTGFSSKLRKRFFDWGQENQVSICEGRIDTNFRRMMEEELFVRPQKVIEVAYRRVLKEPFYELAYDSSKTCYKITGFHMSAKFSMLSFLRERPDKEINLKDISLLQV